jgi:hypothetical protein
MTRQPACKVLDCAGNAEIRTTLTTHRSAVERRRRLPTAQDASDCPNFGEKSGVGKWIDLFDGSLCEQSGLPPLSKMPPGASVGQLGAIAAGLMLLSACSTPGPTTTGAALNLRFEMAGSNLPAGPTGPTFRFDHARGASPGNPIGEFMYFVLLISPDPVTVSESAGNTQRTRIISVTRRFSPASFSVAAEFEFTGEGSHRNTFDPADNIRRHESRLKEGGSLDRVLSSITVEGAGQGLMEVEGVVSNQVATVTEVRLQFNTHGQPSPVCIGLNDIRYIEGVARPDNAIVARVNSLMFQRSAGRPKMAVSVASVKRAGAGDNLWQKLKGNLSGALANLLLKPITIEPAGNDAMLNFGRALAAEDSAFTFPRARNLKADSPVPAAAPSK